MDRLLRLRHPTTPIYSQCRPYPFVGSTHFVVKAGGRRQRRRVTRPAVTKALSLAISFASSFRRILSTEKTYLDLFLLYGGGDAGGRPPIWSRGGSGRWWSRPGNGRSRSKTTAALLVVLSLASAIARVGSRSPERDLGIWVLVPVILGMRIAHWKRWVGLAILGLSLYVLALRSRNTKKRFGWR